MDDLGLETLKMLNKIPVFVCEGHSKALEFINQYIESGHLPNEGNTIVRLNSRPDEIVPQEMLTKTAIETSVVRNSLFDDIGMETWIKKMACDGHLSHVIWMKPPWANQAEDSSGSSIIDNSYGIPKEITVDIVTVGKSLFENGEDDYEAISSLIKKYISLDDPYILDIDLGFFSSSSPFLNDYEKANIYPLMENIFEITVPKSKETKDMQEAAEYRDKQMKELQYYFQYLDEHRTLPVPEKEPSLLYKQVEQLRNRLLEHYEDDVISWDCLFNSGCVVNKLTLPVHLTDRGDIDAMLDSVFCKLLDALPSSPTLITIARSCEYDCFVPWKDCNYVEQNLIKRLDNKLHIDEPEMPYLDQ